MRQHLLKNNMTTEKLEQLAHAFIEKSGLPFVFDKVAYEPETNMLWLTLRTNAHYIPRHKIEEVSGALNHLIRKMFEIENQMCSLLPSLVVDIDGVEKKKIEGLRALAHMMAERSKFFKSKIELDPMPPASRKVIHEFLQGRPNIVTNSTGDGEKRRVVIEYTETVSDIGI